MLNALHKSQTVVISITDHIHLLLDY